MAIDLKDEIVQDFIVEAGEILEQLGQQLVDLETRSDDRDLVAAVFRGFHTIKGGAGFLGLDAMIDVCHSAEDTFNLVRQGERAVDGQLMDTMLRVLDTVNAMFARVAAGNEPAPAEPDLLEALRRLAEGDAGDPAPEGGAPAGSDAGSAGEEITDDEFEALLDSLEKKPPASPDAGGVDAGGDRISDDEFEALLDQIHGAGAPPGGAGEGSDPEPVTVAEGEPASPSAAASPAPRRPAAEATVRVDTGVLDRIMNMVGELVLVRNRIATLESALADEEMAKAASNLDVVTADLQAAVMRTRMQPIRKVFGRFPRVVRDLARGLDKEVELVMEGEETDLDKNLVDALADPLVHLVRNAVDHGIEAPDVRQAAGKARAGRIVLSAEQQGDQILLTIADDGAGIDPDAVRHKAVEQGLLDEDAAARLDDGECYGLIFAAGFSTRTCISDVSGRGVGMDVVKNRIVQLNGTVDVQSALGQGTRVFIRVPLTLAIVPTLMVILGSQIFALPLVNVKEIFDLDLGRTNVVDGQRAVQVRGKPLPLFNLSQWLVKGAAPGFTDRGHVVVVHVGNRTMGFVVDQLVGQQEVVIKPLGAFLHGTKGLAGATITGDGRIALILDVPGLISAYARR